MKKEFKNNKGRTRDQYTAVLEQINSKIDLLAEGHKMLDEKFDRKFGELDDRIDKESGLLSGKINHVETNVKDSFHSIADYLERIEKEVIIERKKGIAVDEFLLLKKRVDHLEKISQ
jgi:hypothetical protein